MQDKHVLISRVADKQFAEQLGVDQSGHFEVLHNGLRFPFYGHPSPELIMQFIYQVCTGIIYLYYIFPEC